MENATLESYLPALGFSAIFLLMLKFVWDYFTRKLEAADKRFEDMLNEQQLRYDKLQEKYLVDLAAGSAMNVRYTRQYNPYDEDTQVRPSRKALNPNLSPEEYQQGVNRMNE